MRGLQVIDNDLIIKNGDFIILADDILVAVQRLLTTNLGEFFLDLDMGLDYSTIKKKGYSIDEIKQAISDCVMQDDRVLSVDDIDIQVKDRKAYISFKFATENETLESEVVV